MKIYLSDMSIEGSHIKGENPLPMFRDRVKDKPVESDGTLSKEECEKMGYEIGFRVLPYKIQDRYDRDKKIINLKTVVLENEYLRAVFLCEYGGRLYNLTDLKTGEELLFTNKVFQLANLSTRNAWFSGGIEWNVGQFGHMFQTCEPLFFSAVKDRGGKEFLRMYEFERTKRLYYSIDFRLEEKKLIAYVRIINDDEYSKPIYWWTNIAVREEKNVRIFSNTQRVIYIHPESIGAPENSIKKFGGATLPDIPSIKGLDASYPLNSPYSNEYFYQNDKECISPFEAAVYDNGFMFFERSSQRLRYRKMFCWGNLKGGRKWQSFLSKDNEGSYLEVQGGLAPTQVHGMDMAENSVIDFVQIFSFANMKENITEAYDKDYKKSMNSIKQIVDKNMSEKYVLDMLSICRKEYENEITEILSFGRGYGALENIRREKYNEKKSPKYINFPKSSITNEMLQWLTLIEKGYMDDIDISSCTVWMIDDKYKKMLLKSIEKKEHLNAASLIHLGIMFYESFDEDKALEFWQKSIDIKETPLAYRNISFYYKQKNDYKNALCYMEKSITLGREKLDKAYYEEYFDLLIKNKEYDKLIETYENIKNKFTVLECEKLIIYLAICYLEKEEYEKLLPIFEMKQVVLREGDNMLLDIYFMYIAREKAKKENAVCSEEYIKKIRMEMDVPENLDFRMVVK